MLQNIFLQAFHFDIRFCKTLQLPVVVIGRERDRTICGLSLLYLSKYKESAKNAENVINGKTRGIKKKSFLFVVGDLHKLK